MTKKIIIGLCALLLWATPVYAATNTATSKLPTSNSYFIVKIKEFVQLNVLAYKKATKAKVLETFSQTRMGELQSAVSQAKNDAITPTLERYASQKTKALELAQKLADQALLNQIKERTLEQERTMTELQIKLENQKDTQENIIRVQKQVANQTTGAVRVVIGAEQADQTKGQIEKIWYAPGTSGEGPPAGWTYAPGTSKQSYAEGTGSGGTATNSQSGQVISGTSGGTAGQKVEGGGQTVSGSSGTSGNTIVGDGQTATGSSGGGGQTVVGE